MVTGYEGYTLSELERMARQEDNKLAVELTHRLGHKKLRLEMYNRHTNYTDGSRRADGREVAAKKA